MDFKGKKILIMGLGVQGGGAGVARFFCQKGAKVTITDLKTEKDLKSSINELKKLPITYILGKHREEDFENADLIIRNPDVPRSSPFLKIALQHKIPVEMDESLFLKLCPNLKNVIGITGTRGKTTTTHLIGAILKEAGFHTLMGGNLRGIATLSLLDKIKPDSKIVLELSSWQLQGLDEDKISPHIAVITNLYPDHLNRYKNMAEYIEDKKIIFKFQDKEDYLILNSENEITRGFAKVAKARVVWFSPSVKLSNLPEKLRGEHNRQNLAAAIQVAKILKIDDMAIKKALTKFKGVKFRLEEIAKINGITYINDTTATTPEAAIAALKAYEGKPIVLLCGGASKKLDLREMGKEIAKMVKAVVLLKGTATDELEKAIKTGFDIYSSSEARSPKRSSRPSVSNNIILGRFNNFRKAIMTAKKEAQSGDIVLLSPGCASFGMFKNEFDRGEQFNEIVNSF